MQLELSDLKTKVLRLTATQHTAQLGSLSLMSEKVDLAEEQILRWRYRLLGLTDDEDQQPIVTSVEVQEQLSQFQESTRNKVHDVRQGIDSLERKVRLLEVARSESWELISQ